jgi:hypothetical protein
VTDKYFIDTGPVLPSAGDGSAGGSASGAETAGGSGATAQGGSNSQEAGAAGAGALAQGGTESQVGEGGAGASPNSCTPGTERCNGHDDNCNDVVDEQACNSRDNGTTGCVGFVISAQPDHGYMLCMDSPQGYSEAQLACEQQSMRLAWLESDGENTDVSAKVKALTSDEAWIGASDAEAEGVWVWDGADGVQFWMGNEDGQTVDDAFEAWMSGTPNDDNGGEDCAVLNATTGLWGDRSCSTRYAYLCEEPE